MVRRDDAIASPEPDTGCRLTPEMLDMAKPAPELWGKAVARF